LFGKLAADSFGFRTCRRLFTSGAATCKQRLNFAQFLAQTLFGVHIPNATQ
jgi:hypothetical protein